MLNYSVAFSRFLFTALLVLAFCFRSTTFFLKASDFSIGAMTFPSRVTTFGFVSFLNVATLFHVLPIGCWMRFSNSTTLWKGCGNEFTCTWNIETVTTNFKWITTYIIIATIQTGLRLKFWPQPWGFGLGPKYMYLSSFNIQATACILATRVGQLPPIFLHRLVATESSVHIHLNTAHTCISILQYLSLNLSFIQGS